MINRLKNSKAGFTLIELMICVSIISILSAIAIPNYLSYRTKGQNTAAKSEARNYYNTAMAYFADVGDSSSPANGAPGFIGNPNVVLGGGHLTNVGGSISVTPPLTFRHNNSATTYTLDGNGQLISSTS